MNVPEHLYTSIKDMDLVNALNETLHIVTKTVRIVFTATGHQTFSATGDEHESSVSANGRELTIDFKDNTPSFAAVMCTPYYIGDMVMPVPDYSSYEPGKFTFSFLETGGVQMLLSVLDGYQLQVVITYSKNVNV